MLTNYNSNYTKIQTNAGM